MSLLYVIAANVFAFAFMFVWEFARLWRFDVRKRNFEAIRCRAASRTALAGWVPIRWTWHGLWRTDPRLELWHPQRRESFTMRIQR